jgi:hypothetical protein
MTRPQRAGAIANGATAISADGRWLAGSTPTATRNFVKCMLVAYFFALRPFSHQLPR